MPAKKSKAAPKDLYPNVPSDIEGDARALYHGLQVELIAMRGAVTPADELLLRQVITTERDIAATLEMAAGAVIVDDMKGYMSLQRLLMAQRRMQNSALASLGLSGDRRGADKNRRKEISANLTSGELNAANDAGKEGKQDWGDLLQ